MSTLVGTWLSTHYRGYRITDYSTVMVKTTKVTPSYLYFVAHDNDGNSKHIRSKSVTDSNYPWWNQWLHFGYGRWKKFGVSIWDEDEGEDDPLSDESVYDLPSYYTSRTFVKKTAYGGGAVYFNYHFRP